MQKVRLEALRSVDGVTQVEAQLYSIMDAASSSSRATALGNSDRGGKVALARPAALAGGGGGAW